LTGRQYQGTKVPFNIALVGLIALVLCLTLLSGWKRDVLLVRRSGSLASSGRRGSSLEVRPDTVAPLGAILIILMAARRKGSRQAPRGDRLMAARRSSSFKQVSKAFGGLRASARSTWSARGEILSVIGPNGAGKTTLFNLVTGHLRAGLGLTSSSTERPSSASRRTRSPTAASLAPSRRSGSF
jgi:hypothetical protein